MVGRGVKPTDPHVSLRTDTALRTQINLVLTPIVAYNVDAVHAHSAKVISAHS